MHRIIAGGTGLIGRRLTEHFLKNGDHISIVGRDEAHIKTVFGSRVQAITWEALTKALLKSADCVINLAGASIGEKRWSKARKKEILDSRIVTTNKIAKLLSELGQDAPVLLNASAIGIYGLQAQANDELPPSLDESTTIDWHHYPDFLSQVGRQWEMAAAPAAKQGVRVVFLRFAVILAKEGGALPKIAKPFEYYLGGPVGTGNQAFSWVAIDDAIGAIDFLSKNKTVSGPFNIVSPQCIKEKEFAHTLAKVLNRPDVMKLPAILVKIMFGQMGEELLLQGQNVFPKRLTEMGFKFRYEDIESALNHVLLK